MLRLNHRVLFFKEDLLQILLFFQEVYFIDQLHFEHIRFPAFFLAGKNRSHSQDEGTCEL